MKASLSLLLMLAGATVALGQDFVPPQAYPMDRYEAGWQKNPFTLRTAPVVMQQESFAKDLVLGGISKIGNSTKVVVVNSKTRARIPLHDAEASAAGISVKSVHLGDSRKNTYVELAMNGQSAVIRYDEGLLKQLAAANGKGSGMNGSGPNGSGFAAPPVPPTDAVPGNNAAGNPQGQSPSGTAPGLVPTALRPSANGAEAVHPITPQRRRLNTMPRPQTPTS